MPFLVLEFVYDEDYFLWQMKLVVLFVAVMMLSCFQPIAAQGGMVLRMCKKKFSSCSSKYSTSNFRSGAKCCGRAWTVSHQRHPGRGWSLWNSSLRASGSGETGLLFSLAEINLFLRAVHAETQRIFFGFEATVPVILWLNFFSNLVKYTEFKLFPDSVIACKLRTFSLLKPLKRKHFSFYETHFDVPLRHHLLQMFDGCTTGHPSVMWGFVWSTVAEI